MAVHTSAISIKTPQLQKSRILYIAVIIIYITTSCSCIARVQRRLEEVHVHTRNKHVMSLKYSNRHREFEFLCCQSEMLQELFEGLKH